MCQLSGCGQSLSSTSTMRAAGRSDLHSRVVDLWLRWAAGNQQVPARFVVTEEGAGGDEWWGETVAGIIQPSRALFSFKMWPSNLNHIFMSAFFSRWNRSVSVLFSRDAPGSSNVVSFHVLAPESLDSSCLKASKERPLQRLRDGLAPFSTSLMFHQPLSRTQYGNCKAWRFARIKHIFNDVTPGWKSSAGQPG